jgi:curved DNA-binding protein CbpA
MAGTPDAYALLGLAPTATPAQVRRAYRRLVVVSHRNRVLGLVEHLEELKLAYETLKDPVRRRAHDNVRRDGHARAIATLDAAKLDAAAPESSASRRREGRVRVEMARELDSLSRRRSADALAATSESMRAIAREHTERERADARRRARRERFGRAIKGVLWVALVVGLVLVARLVAGAR